MTDAGPAHGPEARVRVVPGVDALRAEDGPLFAVVGVFDGLHRGHAYLLEQLVEGARQRGARPAVVTFDSHPDEVLVGKAPPLLLDPVERGERLADGGVGVVVVQHFDDALRRTEYDAFVRMITERTALTGLLMTPDAAFGFERRGTPDTLRALGERSNPTFEVVVVPSFTIDGRPISSSEIRRRVLAGDLAGAEELLGRRYSIVAQAGPRGDLAFGLPVALPPDGAYEAEVLDRRSRSEPSPATAIIDGDRVRIQPSPSTSGSLSITFV
jgi:riboflavin kinase / FMN adenylyltransferase